MEIFGKIVNGFQPLVIFVKGSLLDVRFSSEYSSCRLIVWETDSSIDVVK